MRPVVANLFLSLDGVVEAPERWHPPYADAEMAEAIGAGLASADAFLLGRRTYEEWAGFWPRQNGADNPMADVVNTKPKFVASTTLDAVRWQNSTLLNGDIAVEVARLKAQAGHEIAVTGSATLVHSLLVADLLDELRLMIHPVVVGSGRRLFETGGADRPLELVNSQTFATGVVSVTYRPR